MNNKSYLHQNNQSRLQFRAEGTKSITKNAKPFSISGNCMKSIIFLSILIIVVSCSHKFDREVWVNNSNNNFENPRFDMIEDLQKNYLKKGMSRRDIFKLLDKPKIIDNNAYGIEWTYPIGSNPGFNIDPYSIVIMFDTLGNFNNTEIIKH